VVRRVVRRVMRRANDKGPFFFLQNPILIRDGASHSLYMVMMRMLPSRRRRDASQEYVFT
jgi:hypothetical protein